MWCREWHTAVTESVFTRWIMQSTNWTDEQWTHETHNSARCFQFTCSFSLFGCNVNATIASARSFTQDITYGFVVFCCCAIIHCWLRCRWVEWMRSWAVSRLAVLAMNARIFFFQIQYLWNSNEIMKNSIRFEIKLRWTIRMVVNRTTKRATVVERHWTHPSEPWIVFTLRTHPICRTHTHLSTKRCCDKSDRYSGTIHTNQSYWNDRDIYNTHQSSRKWKTKFHLWNSVSNNFVIESKQQRKYLAN